MVFTPMEAASTRTWAFHEVLRYGAVLPSIKLPTPCPWSTLLAVIAYAGDASCPSFARIR